MFKWIHEYDLILFDFDGLLVNTEELHFAAYQAMCRARGHTLPWSLEQFFSAAHLSAEGLKTAIYKEFPALYQQEPRWEVLYAEKKQAYMRLLQEGRLALMPGVEPLLKALKQANIARCVVTNSTHEQVECIKSIITELKSIPHWVTREQYSKPKPDSECYRLAMSKYGHPGAQVIGFEDSLRGYQALAGSGAQAVLICPSYHPQMQNLPSGIRHLETFEKLT